MSRLAHGAALSAPLVVACGAAMVAERQFRFIPDFSPFEFRGAPTVATVVRTDPTTSTTAPSRPATRPEPSPTATVTRDRSVAVTTIPAPPPVTTDVAPPHTTEVPTPTIAGPPPSTVAPAISHAPSAVGDEASAKRGTTIHLDVLANDFDLDGDLDPLTVTVTAGPTGPSAEAGSLSVKTRNGRDEIDFRAPFVTGGFTFTYQVCDTSGACATASVHVIVTS